MKPASVLALSGLVVPLYIGLLHGWLYLQHRREPLQLWFGLTAASVAGIAALALSRGASLEASGRWANLELALGLALLLAFLRASLSFFAARRTRAETGAWLVVALLLVPLAAGCIVPAAIWPNTLTAHVSTAPPATLGAIARAAVAGALALISALLVRRFAGSMAEAERMASHLHELVEERSRALRDKELQLEHGEQLASLGALAAGVARTIDEPVRVVASHLTGLGSIWQCPERAQEVPRMLAECRQGIERLRVIVSEVLAIARRSDGETQAVDLSGVVASVLPILRPLTQGRVELIDDLRSVPPVLGDRRLLSQVALQLLLNAIQARGNGARDRIRVSVSTRLEGGRVQLRVEDSRPPIPAELLQSIFDPFFTPEEGEGGPALGLAVTHQIVTRHSGRVQVESNESGTRVTVDLPPFEGCSALPDA